MSAQPRLSIGLPVYNGERYLAESLDALLGQSYKDYELIISDNASTDGTADICRQYADDDDRIRYIRQPKNIGAAPNHNFVFSKAKGELFKWAAADDLYARDLLERCVEALDEHPDFVLADSWTAAFNDAGDVLQALPYPLTTDSSSAPERFRSMLFGTSKIGAGLIQADDMYGVMRTDMLRRIPPHGSFFHADRVLMAEIALNGRFFQIPDWLYFRRDHPDRPQHAARSVRRWCANLDPRRGDPLRNPTARLIAEYLWGYQAAIRRAPLSAADRRACEVILLQWIASRAQPALRRVTRGRSAEGGPVTVPRPAKSICLDAIVPGRGREQR
jgi:glycosyltransferase involved in cell wall biosynthesis